VCCERWAVWRSCGLLQLSAFYTSVVSVLQFNFVPQAGSVAAASTARAVSEALGSVARVQAPQAAPWRPKLAAALASLGAAGDAGAAAAAERLQR
jgi:hypothetical protein